MRVSSLVTSVGVHAGVILLLGVASGGSTFQSEMPAFRPEEHKIVYYDFRKKKIPVAPRLASAPRGERKVATAQKPSSAKPLIRLPAPQIKQVENPQTAMARLNSSRAKLPTPPAPKVDAPKAPQPNPSPPEPKPEPDKAPESNNEVVTIARKQAKAFVPPPPSPVKPRLATPTPVLEDNAPTVQGQSIAVRLAAGAGKRALSLGAAPALDAPPAPTGNENKGPDVLVANVNPGARISLPGADLGERSSSTSKDGPPAAGGDVGKAGTRDSSGGAGDPRPKPPDVAPPMKTVLYSERVRMGPPASFSVALRPGARTLPRNIEARFQARNVFTIVVPIENFPGYAGDWIIWFAEKQPGVTAAAGMRAPTPFRKMEPVDQPAGERTAVRLQIAGVLAADGKLGSLTILSTVPPGVEQAVVQDLMNWEFKPAARANTPTEVDIILEIPFSLPVAIAKR